MSKSPTKQPTRPRKPDTTTDSAAPTRKTQRQSANRSTSAPRAAKTRAAASGKKAATTRKAVAPPADLQTTQPKKTPPRQNTDASPASPTALDPASELQSKPETKSSARAATSTPTDTRQLTTEAQEASRVEVAGPPRDAAATLAAPDPVQATASSGAARQDPAPAAEDAPAPCAAPANSREPLYIVHVTPELAGIAKVGGLADVVQGLSRELAIRGNEVEIILPKYATLRYDRIENLHVVYHDLWVPWYEAAIHCSVYRGEVEGRTCLFIEPHSRDDFFNRERIYGFGDDVLRFAFFARAAIEFLWKSGRQPDIIHCHDWQTALLPVFLYELYQPLGMHHPRACLTIHNFLHQGATGNELLRATGLNRPEYFHAPTRLGDNTYRGVLNLLKGGIVYSNFVTTVSPRYAFETMMQGLGCGLEPTLHTHHVKYGGVINGVDYDIWNPEVDRVIPAQYGAATLERKYDNKRALRQRLMLADSDKAIVAFIGRLDPQKGLELVRHAIFHTLERGAQFVLLGSSPDERINADFWGLKRMLNDSPDCHLEIGFDEDLSHLIYAGADIMLVPSNFEPCGLTQLIALRYGTIPVVREVGGLADSVFDKDHSPRQPAERNGYSFMHSDHAGLESALGRAISCYNDYPDDFRQLMLNAMRGDYSWNRPGADYLNIYDFIRDA